MSQENDLSYRVQGKNVCYRDAVLKPYQKELIKEVYSPNDRYKIWIIGKKGNEGKTWFQKCITSIFKPRRVLSGFNLVAKSSGFCHALEKYLLATIHIF